jgi:large subunit ribosomal protein L13
MRTESAKSENIQRKWFVVDAADQPVGRIASRIASVLRGKHSTQFTPHEDAGDFVVVVNVDKIKLTGGKLDTKFYYRHSGYPGGVRVDRARDMLANRPERMLEIAVKGMLPKNSLGRRMALKLKIYKGGTHPHAAQKPEPFTY